MFAALRFLAIFSCPVTRPDLWWDFWPRDKRGEPHMVPRLRGGFHAPNWISSQALDLQFIYILLQVSISSWHWHRSIANINLHIWFAIESKTRIKILWTVCPFPWPGVGFGRRSLPTTWPARSSPLASSVDATNLHPLWLFPVKIGSHCSNGPGLLLWQVNIYWQLCSMIWKGGNCCLGYIVDCC